MSTPVHVSRLRLGHRASLTRTEGLRSTTYHSQWQLFPLGAVHRPESGAVVLDTVCGHCRVPVRVVLDSAPTAARKKQNRGVLGWVMLLAGVALIVTACLIGGGGAAPGLAGVTGLFAVLGSFGVRSTGKAYPGAGLDRDQPAATRNPHRIFVR
ncbi:hypothetical protein [Streptomyces mobaraensis]|uniref:Uncharacterized protein n=1 Tax=Streptomyces mobaraensis TaxID=35621 RepID=A0A5N5W993_STRMB|nr:hypothetical protein [Streptomyces mobaraensis]KAB7846861.1 hypothetical protein FRZ00_11635 [Streptomyces mobaraensis]